MTSQLTTTQRLAIGFSIPLSLIILIAVIGALRVGVIDTTLSGISEGAAMATEKDPWTRISPSSELTSRASPSA